MIARSRKAAKAGSSGEGYRRLLRWAALPVTDRRWAAPLSAVALGFGLFVGVAIGPGAAGTFATGAAQIIEIPGLGGGADAAGEEGDGGVASSGPQPKAGGSESALPAAESAFTPLAPIASSEAGEGTTEVTKPPAQEAPSSGDEPESEVEALAGVVLHVNPAAGSYTIVESGGTLDVVHAAKAPQPGTKVSVPTRLLANGTFAEAGTRTKSGDRARTSFGGIVTYVDPTPTAPAYTVSRRGISVLVHIHPDPAGAPPALPVIGAFAKVTVDIEKLQPAAVASAAAPEGEPAPPAVPSEPPAAPPAPTPEPTPTPAPAPALPIPPEEPPASPAVPACAVDPSQPLPPEIQPGAVLWQRQLSAQGAPFTSSDFAGIVEAVCPDSGQLLISADDIRASQHDLVFTVPGAIDTTKLKAGQSIIATATIGTDGSLGLTGLANDERIKGAEEDKAVQGDLIPSKVK